MGALLMRVSKKTDAFVKSLIQIQSIGLVDIAKPVSWLRFPWLKAHAQV